MNSQKQLILRETVNLLNPAESKKWIEKHYQDWQKPCIVLLDGDLGSGKTFLVRIFCEFLGIKQSSSPTFSLHQNYHISLENRDLEVQHWDLYRLENQYDLETSGFWEMIQSPDGPIFIEWSSRISLDQLPSHLPIYCIKMSIDLHGRKWVYLTKN